MEKTVFRRTSLIPFLMEGYDGTEADVTVEDGRIASILPPGKRENRDLAEGGEESGRVIDAAGKTLMPGLIDLHMHMYFTDSNFPALALKTQNEQFVDSLEYLKWFLEQGYTTVRDCGNPRDIGVSVRDAIRRGIVAGPRVFAAGRCITPTAKGNETFPNLYDEVDRTEDIRGVCRKEYAAGIDFLKYMATGSVANVTGEPGAMITTRRELEEMQRAAEELGTYAAVHCHGTKGILACIETGIKTIEHASFLTKECIDRILALGNRTALVPTLAPVVQMYEDRDGDIPEYLKKKIKTIYEAAGMLVEAERKGVRLGWGTDCSLTFLRSHPGYEFYARKKIGFTEEEILRQVTINSAEILGIEDLVGTVKVGKKADLILVEGDPQKDLSVLARKPELVMQGSF